MCCAGFRPSVGGGVIDGGGSLRKAEGDSPAQRRVERRAKKADSVVIDTHAITIYLHSNKIIQLSISIIQRGAASGGPWGVFTPAAGPQKPGNGNSPRSRPAMTLSVSISALFLSDFSAYPFRQEHDSTLSPQARNFPYCCGSAANPDGHGGGGCERQGKRGHIDQRRGN